MEIFNHDMIIVFLIWCMKYWVLVHLDQKPRKGKRKDGTKYLKQYKWRCTFRDAYQCVLY